MTPLPKRPPVSHRSLSVSMLAVPSISVLSLRALSPTSTQSMMPISNISGESILQAT